jgi:hypothetical protein
MDFFELGRMAEKRSYRMEHPKSDHFSEYHLLRGKDVVARISVFELDFLTAYNLAGFLDRAVSIHTRPGQSIHHHVMCKQCKTPLLRCTNHHRALDVYRSLESPPWTVRDGTLEMDPAIELRMQEATRTEYRLAILGPDSQPLEKCPMCGVELNDQTVSEIDD